MSDSTFFFYDLETTGFNPREARIMQFAGQRTDMNLRRIGEPVNYLIKLTPDVLPDPDAILITGITPQKVNSEGLVEAEFLRIFHDQIAVPNTIFVGFNTIRFDDEFMRFLNYRNFYDPYEWQWKDGRSKWDLLDVVRMTRALRPEGINWPFDSNGAPSNRLEFLSKINKLDHTKAHDALSDVYATIAVAGLIKEKQPKLFNYLLKFRDKKEIEKLVLGSEPFIYTSGKYPAEFEKTTVVSTIAEHPSRSGAALVYDLRHDPEPYLKLNAKEIAECWRWKPDKTELRLPIKTLQYNRCPAIAPIQVLDASSEKRLKIERKSLQTNLEKLKNTDGFIEELFKAIELMNKAQQEKLLHDSIDVDGRLYEAFFDNSDKILMSTIHTASAEKIQSINPEFKDERLRSLWPLYKARNYPDLMSDEDRHAWEKFVEHKLTSGKLNSRLANYFDKIQQLKQRDDLSGEQSYILEELLLYGASIVPDELVS